MNLKLKNEVWVKVNSTAKVRYLQTYCVSKYIANVRLFSTELCMLRQSCLFDHRPQPSYEKRRSYRERDRESENLLYQNEIILMQVKFGNLGCVSVKSE